MRIVIEIDEHKTPSPPPEVSMAPAAPGTAPADAASAINAGAAAPLVEQGAAEADVAASSGLSDGANNALSAGAAPEPDDTE